MKAILALEDGKVFEGESFGATGEAAGEVVFNTGMSGYQEVLTDPSYSGQMVAMTYPLIGNYGVNREDVESDRVQVEAFIVKEVCRHPSNHRSTGSLDAYLAENNVMGVEGIDTRALTRHIRLAGAMKGVLSTEDPDRESLVRKAGDFPGLVGRDLVKGVTCQEAYTWAENGDGFRVVVIDCGVKFNILRILERKGCSVRVVPASTPAEAILGMEPDGVFLSNGPGDPAGVPYVYGTVRELAGKLPVFGICLGQQMLGLAMGGRTYKLKFGHRGANHPVKNVATGRIEITTQNHGFCVDMDSLPADELEVTHINLNDNTCEGLSHREYPLFSVQYHPEAGPGPHDSEYLFDRFIEQMKK